MTIVAGLASATLNICNAKGLHARAAAKFVRCVSAHDARVLVEKDGNSVDGDSIMGLLMLAAAQGCTIDVSAEGPQAEEVIAALRQLTDNRFDEEA